MFNVPCHDISHAWSGVQILKYSFEKEVCDEGGALGCWFQYQVPLFLTSPLPGEGVDNHKLSRFLTQARLVVKYYLYL